MLCGVCQAGGTLLLQRWEAEPGAHERASLSYRRHCDAYKKKSFAQNGNS